MREASLLNQLGWCVARLDDFNTARDHCRAALTLYQRYRDRSGEASALDSLGFITHRTGDYRLAVGHYNRAPILRRARGHIYGVPDTPAHLGHPRAAAGQHDQARVAWREALELYREQGRQADAERVRRQIDDLDHSTSANPDEEAAGGLGEVGVGEPNTEADVKPAAARFRTIEQ